jgi:hypothetical protein
MQQKVKLLYAETREKNENLMGNSISIKIMGRRSVWHGGQHQSLEVSVPSGSLT